MGYPISSASYLARAQGLRKKGDKASLIYAALELRCGIEARLQEHASVAHGLTKKKINEWQINKLARSIEQSFGFGDTILIVFLTMDDGRSCQFMYAPVSARLQEIGMRCGDYLHALRPEKVGDDSYWMAFRSLVTEGCGLLELSCASEILRPNIEAGFHFNLRDDDPRVPIVQDLLAGQAGKFTTATIAPTGPMTYYPSDDEA